MANILVIDDDPSIRILFNQFLSRTGHTVTLAENGKQGLRSIRETAPDLIITDIMMPEADGLELLMAIRQEHLATPVIAISGGMLALPINFLHQARMLGARHVFSKPVPLDALQKAIEECLSGT